MTGDGWIQLDEAMDVITRVMRDRPEKEWPAWLAILDALDSRGAALADARAEVCDGCHDRIDKKEDPR